MQAPLARRGNGVVMGLSAGWLGWLMFGTVMASAQPADLEGLFGPKAQAKKRIARPTVTATFDPVAPKVGETVTLQVAVTLPEGYYIYGVDGKFAGRTQIALETQGLRAVDAGFRPLEPGKTVVDSILKAEVTKHPGGAVWQRRFLVTAGDSAASKVQVTGTIEGQYCSEPTPGTENVGQCVPLVPPLEFAVEAAVAAVGPTADSSPTTTGLVQTVQPMRKTAAGEVADDIRFVVELVPPTAPVGSDVELRITATIAEGFHTYSLSQRGPGASPTEIDVTDWIGLKPSGRFAAHPAFVVQKTADLTLEKHEGTVTWSQTAQVTAAAYGVAGTLTYQLCDDRGCRPAREVTFAVGSSRAGGTVAMPDESDDSEASPFSASAPEAIVPDDPSPAAAMGGADRGLFTFLFLCVGGGFLALLTPCSFPMVPITVSFFLKQGEQHHKQPLILALVYCGTIVAAFTVLGVGISFIYGAAALNALANNAWVNLAIGLVFVVFGFNMLGFFEISVPSWMLNWSASHETRGSYAGAIFMAITFVLTSFTCTFAVAGTLLVEAARGEFTWPILGMLTFGAAFASPFFVLALVPSLLTRLPKSGGWMTSVKVVMGLIEFGAAVKYFSVADLSWNPRPLIFSFPVTMTIWCLLSVAIGAYLVGLYRFPHDTRLKRLSWLRSGLGAAFLALAALIGGLIVRPTSGLGGWLGEQIVAFAPPRIQFRMTEFGPALNHEGTLFALDVEQAIPFAQKTGRPLLFDFTGVNCVNCRLMEAKMAEAEYREKLGRFVNVQLYADSVPYLTDREQARTLRDRNVKLQVQWFVDVTLPSYAVVTPDGKTILAKFSGLESKKGEFGDFLDFGWKRWQALQSAGQGPERR